MMTEVKKTKRKDNSKKGFHYDPRTLIFFKNTITFGFDKEHVGPGALVALVFSFLNSVRIIL